MRKLHAKYEVRMTSTKTIFENLFLHNFVRRIRFCYSHNHICSISCQNLEILKIRPMVLAKTRVSSKVSRHLPATGLIPSERALKIMGVHIENERNHEVEPQITWDKGVPGHPTGGTPSSQSGGPMPDGGEYFAPRNTPLIQDLALIYKLGYF